MLNSEKENFNIDSVQEKIHLEKQLPFRPKDKKGPTIELYFHEINRKPSLLQKTTYLLTSIFLTFLFLITLPFCAIIIWAFTGGPVFQRVNVPGRRGIVFQYWSYSTRHIKKTSQKSRLGDFLYQIGLHKLPSVINIWKGQMNIVGPAPYAEIHCNTWNQELSDYYKRFAFKPGFFGVGEPIKNFEDLNEVEKSLEQEFNYLLNPTLSKDLKNIF